MDFVPYPKTPRLKRDIVITEKIDGSNAQIVIVKPGHDAENLQMIMMQAVAHKTDPVDGQNSYMLVGSRNRWVKPGKDTDNFGFAGWCQHNANDLFTLGEGTHFGEWWGLGIARGYNQDRKRFSLFNTARWGKHNPSTPACCDVVPVLRVGQLLDVNEVLFALQRNGSMAAPGFMKPEGIIVYHSAAKQNFKVLLENDELPKGVAEKEAA